MSTELAKHMTPYSSGPELANISKFEFNVKFERTPLFGIH